MYVFIFYSYLGDRMMKGKMVLYFTYTKRWLGFFLKEIRAFKLIAIRICCISISQYLEKN